MQAIIIIINLENSSESFFFKQDAEICHFQLCICSCTIQYFTSVGPLIETIDFIAFICETPVSVAVARINEILMGGKGGGPTGGGLVRTSGAPPPMTQHQLAMPPQHQPPPQSPAPMMPVPTMQMPPVHQPPPMLAAPVQPPEIQQVWGTAVVLRRRMVVVRQKNLTGRAIHSFLQGFWQGHMFVSSGVLSSQARDRGGGRGYMNFSRLSL